jgi:hypothetical protein
MFVVAVVGLIGSGKDSFAQHLVDNHDFLPIAFADALKDVVSHVFCWSRALLEGEGLESRNWRETIDPWWSERLGIPHLTPRWVLQNVGTDVMRKHLHPDIWTLNVERRISQMVASGVVITDARFPNEIGLARRLGGRVVRIRRGSDPQWFVDAQRANTDPDEEVRLAARDLMRTHHRIHESEWAWVGQHFDAVIANDRTLADLHAQAERFIR